MPYLFVFISAFLAVALLTPLIRLVALRWQIVDLPNEPRKIHTRPTPLLGGLAIFAGLMAVLWYVALATPYFVGGALQLKHLLGMSLGVLVLILGGVLDDKYNLSPRKQIVFSTFAALIIIVSGIGIRAITNPFGGEPWSLVWWEKVLFWWQGVGYRLTLPADLLTLVWLMLMMYTTKLLDGLDGLVSGLTVIGALMIFLLATTTKFFQPEVGVLALIVAGAFAGFLLFNWHPAKIFLGTGGSTLAGFLLGTLAIISGSKIATTLLVVGIPLLDLVWVAVRRALLERKSPFRADRAHLHFRLLEAGLSHRTVVVVFWILAVGFGVMTLFLQSAQKLVALGVLAVLMVAIGSLVVWRSRVIQKL